MALAVLPLLLSAVATYSLLHRGVMADFDDIAHRYGDQLTPLQHLQLTLKEATEALKLYVDGGSPAEVTAYRGLRETIETRFTELDLALTLDTQARATTASARADWDRADIAAQELLAHRWAPGQQTEGVLLVRRVDAAVAAAIDQLAAATAALTQDLAADHLDADRSYERSEWLTGIAAAVSLVSIIAGALIIGRFLRVSVDRLVEGAARFADGDRDHRIEIQVPPELHRVAEEFNHMILRIRDNEDALAELARRDRLTGLLNRRAFEESVGEALQRKQRFNEDLAILMVDVDHFKPINDRFGHPAGDLVLQQVAAALTANIRVIDKAFRFGGEEFVVLLSAANGTIAIALAERVRAAVAEHPMTTGATTVAVTVSLGIATAGDADSAAALIAKADAAMYHAKQRGRNCVVVDGERA